MPASYDRESRSCSCFYEFIGQSGCFVVPLSGGKQLGVGQLRAASHDREPLPGLARTLRDQLMDTPLVVHWNRVAQLTPDATIRQSALDNVAKAQVLVLTAKEKQASAQVQQDKANLAQLALDSRRGFFTVKDNPGN